ncbi:MAG: hypothetical protein VXY41_00590, partial [Pseudomonadota bacterium]|nr:hypothetical protein [Pseudomonadota bacterium]
PEDVATYLLNNKRTQLLDIESQTGLRVMVQADRDLTAMEMAFTLPDQTESEGTMRMEGDPAALADDATAAKPKRNRRRRSNKTQQEHNKEPVAEDAGETDEESDAATVDIEDSDEGKTKRRRRRGRRGGRRRRRNEDSEAIASEENSDEKSADAIASDTEDNIAPEAETGDEAAPPEMDAPDTENTANDITASDENTDTVLEIAGAETADEAVDETINEDPDDTEAGSARKGWWRRS